LDAKTAASHSASAQSEKEKKHRREKMKEKNRTKKPQKKSNDKGCSPKLLHDYICSPNSNLCLTKVKSIAQNDY
jgi:hypothetical protein